MTTMIKSALRAAVFTVANLVTTALVGNAAPPSIELAGPNPFTNECHTPYVEPGVRITGRPVALAAGSAHSLALKADGSVVAWGMNHVGQTNVPSNLPRVVAIAAGAFYSLALTADGAVVSWGEGPYGYGDTNVPPEVTYDVAAIAAAYYHAMAVRADDSIIMWGQNYYPPEFEVPSAATNVVALAAGLQHSLALRRDGTVVGWGFDPYGENIIPTSVTNVVAIADSGVSKLALRSDGTIIRWGLDDQFHLLGVPARATNIVAIAAADLFCAAVRADGAVIPWGLDYGSGIVLVPVSATNIIGVAAGGQDGGDFCLALRADGAVLGWGRNDWKQCNPPPGLTNLDLPWSVSGVLNTDAVGTYTLTYTATNILGEVGRVTRTVEVVDTTPPELICPTNHVVELTDTAGATVYFSASATDLCAGSVPVTFDPPSGSKFPVGTNLVFCTSVDGSGNTSLCSFTVTVIGARTVKMNVLAEIVRAAESQRIPLLDFAIRSLTRSLTVEWWQDELRLNPKYGAEVFRAEAETVLFLRVLQQQRHGVISDATLQDWIGRLLKVDRLLAIREIEFATDAGASPRQLSGAIEMMAKGNEASRNGNDALAISFYERAWSIATRPATRLTESQ